MRFPIKLRSILRLICLNPVQSLCQWWCSISLRLTLGLFGLALCIGFWLATAEGTPSVHAAPLPTLSHPHPSTPAPSQSTSTVSLASLQSAGPRDRRTKSSNSTPRSQLVTPPPITHEDLTRTVLLGHHLTHAHLFSVRTGAKTTSITLPQSQT